ncbi:GPI ethanolamine phosphate transferase 2, catalytic subunit-like [Xylocopa sonorina]|uniref:GPI ethanolamine phosphate transferase 2, catalytic subunit-like n=1 Tax=Xylocopa sonorina TaxID=1818115 RepID=UPI00403B2EDE
MKIILIYFCKINYNFKIKTKKKMDKNTITLFYVALIGPFSISLFLYGFFPLVNLDNSVSTQDDIPTTIENARIKLETLYQPMVKRLVLMIIDALRWDFIVGPTGIASMPVTSALLNSSACLLRTRVQPPTVTMPRIKAITTGTIPSFIDVVLNFGAKPVSGDSVLLQAKRAGHEAVFYGDDTWITLFPSIFARYDGTTSFVVTDFTQVDDNVTRHLDNELYDRTDWSVMVLHYLGLDHIGHVQGPFSPLIETKLAEMDAVIGRIQSRVHEWNQRNESTLFIICGDHGMKDSGGHGGSTISETTVPLIAIGGDCAQIEDHFVEISQIDIAPTLAMALGLPIPHSNVGTAFLDTLYDLPASKKLFLLYYNSKQLFEQFKRLAGYESEYAYEKYLEAMRLHIAWLNSRDHPNDTINDIVLSYRLALQNMKELLINSTIKYDFQIIMMATLFLCHITCISMGRMSSAPAKLRNVGCFLLSNLILWTLVNFLWQSEDVSLLRSTNSIAFMILLPVILIANSFLLAGIESYNFLSFEKMDNRREIWLFSLGSLIHAISLGGSSFVEEEHQTWYFYWATILALLLYDSIATLFLSKDCQRCSCAQNCLKLALLLAAHRILRKLNSTGDKYANLPDIAAFLIEQESSLAMTIVLVSGLALLMSIDFNCGDEEYKYQSLILNFVASICIYLRHMENNSVLEAPINQHSVGSYGAKIFWLVLAMHFVNYAHSLVRRKRSAADFLRPTLYFILRMWITMAAMLHQPQNVALLPLQVILSSVASGITQDAEHRVATFLYNWLGNVFYFYQGNSNSLATIDVAAGYVGVQSYVPLINGSLLIINTYAAPVLAYLLLVYHIVQNEPYDFKKACVRVSRAYIACRLLPLTLYTVIISIQRHHLFVWSVFSPKLLYETAHSIIICFTTLIVLFLLVKSLRRNSKSKFRRERFISMSITIFYNRVPIKKSNIQKSNILTENCERSKKGQPRKVVSALIIETKQWRS